MLSSPFKYLNRKSISYLSRPFKHPPEFTIIIVNQHHVQGLYIERNFRLSFKSIIIYYYCY